MTAFSIDAQDDNHIRPEHNLKLFICLLVLEW